MFFTNGIGVFYKVLFYFYWECYNTNCNSVAQGDWLKRPKGRIKMEKLKIRIGSAMAALAMRAAALNVNATCTHHLYQAPVPEDAKKLSKVK